MDAIAVLTILAIYLGFAALLGGSARQFSKRVFWLAAAGLAILVYAAGLPPVLGGSAAALALGVLVIYAVRWQALPEWFWSAAFGWCYACAVMGLIWLWGIVQFNPGSVVLAGFACAAGILTWQKRKLTDS